MKLTFSKKGNISRKGLLWVYFLFLIGLSLGLGIFAYLLVMNAPETTPSNTSQTVKVDENALKYLSQLKYTGRTIDSSNLGKTEPFR